MAQRARHKARTRRRWRPAGERLKQTLLILLSILSGLAQLELLPWARARHLGAPATHQEPPPLGASDPPTSLMKAAGLASFAPEQPARVVGSRWQPEVYLPCKILDLDETQTVSWVRKRDSLVLSVDKLKLVDEPRFQLAQGGQDWTLAISQPVESDAGFYECQVPSMEPKLSRLVELQMVEARSHISNMSALFVRPNESLNVTCTIEAPQETDFVYWYKNKEPIHFDNLKARRAHKPADETARWQQPAAGGRASGGARRARASSGRRPVYVTRARSDAPASTSSGAPDLAADDEWPGGRGQVAELARGDAEAAPAAARQQPVKRARASSTLLIKRAQANETANYTCLPSNARPSHIKVVVIENSAQSQPEKRSLSAVDGAIGQVRGLSRGYQIIWLQSLKILRLGLDNFRLSHLNVIPETSKMEQSALQDSSIKWQGVFQELILSQDSISLMLIFISLLHQFRFA